jgi:hypothetical protein
MAKTGKRKPIDFNFIDLIRRGPNEGPLIGACLSTYGLEFGDQRFLETDFLPTLLDLGGTKDLGYTAPISLERKLAEVKISLVCDKHAFAEEKKRPSLRIDINPIGDRLQHGKVVLIHRKNMVRLIVGSANLSFDGYRISRESAAVLDFREEGGLDPKILARFAVDWLENLGRNASDTFRGILEKAVAATKAWPTHPKNSGLPSMSVVLGGGSRKLWQQVAALWPEGEPLVGWMICSPFWPGGQTGVTPFESISKALENKGCSLHACEISLYCRASQSKKNSFPVFPFQLLEGLRARRFPVRSGKIYSVQPEAKQEGNSASEASGLRPLHSKWMVLQGPKTSVIFLGSANFTNTGYGVVPKANLESGVLMACPSGSLDLVNWIPPVDEDGIVDWATAHPEHLSQPSEEEVPNSPWPNHLYRLELAVDWEEGSEPNGRLACHVAKDICEPTRLYLQMDGKKAVEPLFEFAEGSIPADGVLTRQISKEAVAVLLRLPALRVLWGETEQECLFPVNIQEASREGLPYFLGIEPDELTLLAYFQGRIDEDDVIAIMKRQLEESQGDSGIRHSNDQQPDGLQNYLVREFVEGLPGQKYLLVEATKNSPGALESALHGEFSPVALARRIAGQFRGGKRTATATGFQLAEILRVITELPETKQEGACQETGEIKKRAIGKLVSIFRDLSQFESFRNLLADTHFGSYLATVLPKGLSALLQNTDGTFVKTESRGS